MEIIIKQLKQTFYNWSSWCSKLRGLTNRVTNCHGFSGIRGFSECGTFNFKIITIPGMVGRIWSPYSQNISVMNKKTYPKHISSWNPWDRTMVLYKVRKSKRLDHKGDRFRKASICSVAHWKLEDNGAKLTKSEDNHFPTQYSIPRDTVIMHGIKNFPSDTPFPRNLPEEILH